LRFVVNEPEQVDYLQDLRLAGLLDHCLEPRIVGGPGPLRLPVAVEQVWSPIVKHQMPAALGNQAISTIAHEEGRISPALSFPSALAVPAASSMEAAGHAVSKTAGVGEPCTMIEAATYAMAEAAADSGDTRTMGEAASHAMTQAVAEFAVASIVGSIGAIG